MAIKKTVNTPCGFEAIDAYHRVEGVQINKGKMNFQVRIYKENSGSHNFAELSFYCEYDIQGDNPIKQAYKYLKTLPEFANAVDC
jgi:hypothetical protein